MTMRFTKLSETALGILIAFPNCYMREAGFSHIMTKQRNGMDVGERADLRLKLQPNIHVIIKSHRLHPSH